jgi:polyisoprenoid-binding protein YceI
MRLTRYLLAMAALLIGSPAYALDHYEFDKSHTHVRFLINHLGYSNMLGVFTDFNGTLSFDPKHPEESTLDVTLYPKGIRTTSEILDSVLQGRNFFNTGKYPEIHFASKSVKITGERTGDVTGDLTMMGVTKPLTLHVTFNKADYQPVTNFYVAGFSAYAELKRSDFGMTYGIPMVADDVRVDMEAEAINIDRKNAEKLKH